MPQEALKYLSIGFSPFPLGDITRKPDGKKNIVYPLAWTTFQTKRATEKEIKSWPYKNLGIATGKVSGILVLDLDSYKPNFNKELVKSLHLPPTPTQQTASGGRQLFFKYPANLTIKNAVSIGDKDSGIDIRGDGGMVVAPPSTTTYGEYSWIISPFDAPLAEIPPALMDILKLNSENKKVDWDIFFSEQKNKGVRNVSAASIAGKLLYEMSPDIWDTLGLMTFRTWNKEFNNPPLPEDELLTTWKSVKGKHLKNNKPPETTTKEEEDIAEDEEIVIREFAKNKAKGTYLLAKYLTNKYSIITVGEKEREMSVYRDGVYFRAENEIIFPEIQRVLSENVTKNAKTETFHKIADATAHPRSIFESSDPKYIPLKNCVYNFETKELLPHDPKYHFTYQLPVIFNPEAICPKTEAFFNQVLDEYQVSTLQEWLGYYFYRNYMFKKAIIFVGEGDTGKTTLLEVITYLLGRDNISSVSLQKMTSDKFAAAHLYEKHGNLVDELSAKDITDTGNFKIATGGGSISGEYKFGNQFSFKNFSKFTFACNKIPDVTDFDDEAYFNRWMVVRFEKPITKKIPNFIETLTIDEERSGLFNYAMVGLVRLLEQGHFTYNLNGTDTKTEMMRSGSSVAMFAAEQLVQEIGSEMTKESMYERYCEFCQENGLASETLKSVGIKLPAYATYVKDGRITEIGGKQIRGWRNVVFIKNEEEKKIDEQWDSIPEKPKKEEEDEFTKSALSSLDK